MTLAVSDPEAEDRPATMHAVAAVVVAAIASGIADHLTRVYHLGAERAGVTDPQPIELLALDRRIEQQQAYLESGFATALLQRLETARTADDIDEAFADLESRAEMYADATWTTYQAAFKDFGVPEQLVEFRGPDDEKDCEFCRESVEGNPYPLAMAPEPGAGECLSHCRHELVPLENGELPETY